MRSLLLILCTLFTSCATALPSFPESPVELEPVQGTAPTAEPSRPVSGSVSVRAGVFLPSDSAFEDAGYGGTWPSVSVQAEARLGGDGRFSIVTGVDFQWDSGGVDVFPIASTDSDAYIVSVPVMFGVNSATRDQWRTGKVPNFFGGVGAVGFLVHEKVTGNLLTLPIEGEETEYGVGFIANIAAHIPLGTDRVYLLADARYSLKPINVEGEADDVGGLAFTAGIGFVF